MRDEKEVGRIVRELRGALSLREFGEKCDISHTTIDNIEKGIDFRTGKPTQAKIATIQKIADACGVPISYIIGEDSQTPLQNGIVFCRNGSEERLPMSEEQLALFDAFLAAYQKNS